MNSKTKKIIYWVLTGLVSFVFLGSTFGKLTGNEEVLKMAANFGLDSNTYLLIGVVELASLMLFLIPRTGIIGTMLLSAFMGGAIATHLEHNESVVAPCLILTFTLLVAAYRFPELVSKLMNKKN